MITFRDILTFWFRHQTRILVLFAVTTVTVTGLAYYFPEKYEVQTKLLVKMGRENAAISPAVTNPTIWSVGKQMKEVMRSEVEILNSMFLVEMLVEDLGIEFFAPPKPPPETILQHLKSWAKAILRGAKNAFYEVLYFLDILREVTDFEGTVLGVKKSLFVEAEKDSNVIRIVYTGPDPDISRPALDRLIELYLEHRRSVYADAGLFRFFQGEVSKYEALRQEAANELASYRRETGIADLGAQKANTLEQYLDRRRALDDTRMSIRELEVQVAEAQRKQREMESMEVVREEVTRNPALAIYDTKLVELEAQREQMRQRYADDVPIVVSLDREIASLRALIEGAPTEVLSKVASGSNPTYKALEGNVLENRLALARLGARAQEEEASIGSLRRELEEMNRHESELNRLQIELDITQENWVMHKRKLEEARISGALDRDAIGNVTVVGPASSSIVPLKKMRFIPRKLYFIVLAMIGSLGVGILYALCLDYFDHTIRDERDAGALDVPVMGGFFMSEAEASSDPPTPSTET